jgi:hypothetical protein
MERTQRTSLPQLAFHCWLKGWKDVGQQKRWGRDNTVLRFLGTGPNHVTLQNLYILCGIDPLLGKDLETNNETTAVAMQWHGKHASATIELLLETVFSTRSVQTGYKEGNLGDPVSWKSACEEKTRRLVWNGLQPGSCQLRRVLCRRLWRKELVAKVWLWREKCICDIWSV